MSLIFYEYPNCLIFYEYPICQLNCYNEQTWLEMCMLELNTMHILCVQSAWLRIELPY